MNIVSTINDMQFSLKLINLYSEGIEKETVVLFL
jgi:hypothetical protein